MRAVVQRVGNAKVNVEGKEIAAIGEGLLALVGIHEDDTNEDLEYICGKILGLRIFNDENGVMNRSVTEVDGEVLLVSQFTLYGDVRKGRRPSYSNAMNPDRATVFFEHFVSCVRDEYSKVKQGVFGAHMEISLINSGPVTILLDSTRTF